MGRFLIFYLYDYVKVGGWYALADRYPGDSLLFCVSRVAGLVVES